MIQTNFKNKSYSSVTFCELLHRILLNFSNALPTTHLEPKPPNTRFRWPFTELGFAPEISSGYMLPRIVGRARSAELLLLGGWLSAEEAQAYGLVNAVLPTPKDAYAKALSVATWLAKQNQTSLQTSKKILNAHVLKFLDEGGHMDLENWGMQHTMNSEETMAAMMAFMEKMSGKGGKTKL